MLKFVSTKPPKGGQPSQGNTDEKPRKKKGSFRWKIFSKRENPQTFENHDKSDELDTRRDKDCERNMDEYLTNQADYDNYDSSQMKDSSQKGVNGKVAYTRSWSAGSDSSVDSYRGSQSRKHIYDPYKGQSHPLRHVTWSPDVTDGSEHGFSFDTSNIMGNVTRQHEKDNIVGNVSRQHEKDNIVGNDSMQHGNIVGNDSGQHEDYYWDNLEQFNSSQPFKLFHQGTCALDENGPFYQTINKKTPPVNVSSGQSHPTCSRRLEFYPRDQFIHHVGKPILNRKYEMYPSVTLPHRTKSSTATAAAANSYATVGPRTLKRNYNIPYSVPVSSTKSSQQSIPMNVSHDKPKLPPLNIPIHRNLMRNYSVPYCVSSEPISSPREISVNSKLIFSPSIYSTPKQRKEYGSDRTVKSWDQKPAISTDYDRLLTTEDYFKRPSSEGPSLKISKPFSDPLYKEDKYLDFIQNIRKRYPQQGTNELQSNTAKPTMIVDSSLQGTSQPNGTTRVSDKFEERKYGRRSNGYEDVTEMYFPHVMTSCVPQINNHDVKHETVNRYHYSTRDQFSGSPGMSQSSTLRNMITRAQDHHGNREDDQLVLDLVYITERIISMSFPSDGHETTYQYNLNEVMNMLKQKHGDNCMVINVSEQRPDLQKVNTQRVVDYGWPAHLAPPLERLCNICKSMDSWLNSDPSHVAVIHCKGGQDRIAMVIAAFMHYCNICASSDQAMDRFAMKRFYDDKLSGILQPAQERYVQYFAGLLSGKIKINSNPLYLHHLVIHGVPNFDTKGGCRPFIKVYQGMQAIFTSGVYNVTDQMQKVCISISPGIPLRGDIMIKCFHKHNSGGREPIWTTQFHTCAISNMNVLFAKNELDEAKDDPRFPRIGKVEFVFGKSQDSRVLVHDFKSDVTVPVIDEDGLKRSESYENFLRAGGLTVDVQHHRTKSVERTEKTEVDKTRSLDELEKSLQAASNSIIATQPTWQVQNQQQQQQQTGNQGFQKIEQTQRVTRKYETRTFETHNQEKQERVSNEEPRSMSPTWDNVSPHVTIDTEIQDSELDAEVLFLMSKYSEDEQRQEIAAPRPKHINVVEEDRFSLRPIGPGMQPLEPEGIQTGTLPRSTTPSFPVSPVSTAEQVIQSVHQKVRRLSLGSVRDLHVTPPFPITPRSPYNTMQASMPSLSPTTPPVFDKDEHYNRIVSRQIARSTSDRTSDPLYASIPEDLARRQKSATHQQNHQQHQQQQQTQQQTEHREYKYQTQQNYNYNQQPGQQFVTGSQQNVNMIEGMPPQNIPIQHQQGGSQFNTMSSTQGSVPSPQGFNTLGSNQSYRTESHDKYHTMGSTGSQDRFGTMGSQPDRFATLGSQQERFGTVGSQQDRFGTTGSQNFSTMSSGHQQQFGTMGSQQNGTLHVDTRQGHMHSGSSSAGSPHSPETLNQLRQQLHVAHNMSSSSGGALSPGPHSMTGQSSPSVYFGLSRRGSLTSLADNADAVHATPKFVKNTSKYWYMPNITREEAIQMLKDKSPGTFVVRDSNSFPGAFGLALKVATIPANVQTKSSGDPAADLVRHFLIEPTPKGVRLRGCSNEPVFGSLASLVYQHSITPLALPCKLVLPEVVLPRFVPCVPVYEDQAMESSMDVSHTSELPSSAAALLAQGAACNVLYINSIDTESLTGPQAVARALKLTSEMGPPPTSTVVHFKVSNQGITLTDNQRKLFFRRHYPVSAVTYCGMDPEGRKWKRDADIAGVQLESRVFGFVARKHSGASDNACHLFAELDPEQPASAIVNFVTKIMIGQSSKK
ncbi:tensin-3-like isoform X21 [Mytilus californianus]|uniref:tensin-3-like isoform X21 n=1 Tax=Mytilus californianus TaxID=6549 RepID=UPI0022463049|nr:tensin-3-like isoform X21 [Mytilus californianus]